MRKSSGDRRFVVFCLFFREGGGGGGEGRNLSGETVSRFRIIRQTHFVVKELNNFEIDSLLFRLVRKRP